MATWRQQFEASLLQYAIAGLESERYTALGNVGSVDEYIDGYVLDRQHEDDAPATALRALAILAFGRAFRELEEPMNRTESPIELAMLLALTLAGRDRLGPEGDVYFAFGGRPAEADDYDYISIDPQVQLGEHRVDFLVTLSSLEPVDMATARARDGPPPDHITRRMNPRGWIDHKLIVECDGHDFHDRTKAQASRDRARDRGLQAAGFQVFRYTGSDIWRDVMACATEVIDALFAEIRRVWHEPDAHDD